MKVYYSQKENHFIGGGLGQLQNNNLYVSNHVIELLVQQENNIMWLNNGEDFVALPKEKQLKNSTIEIVI